MLASAFGFVLAAYYTAFAGVVHDYSGFHFAEVFGLISSTAALPGTLFSSPLYGTSVSLERSESTNHNRKETRN